jgi:rare lipoprotein A
LLFFKPCNSKELTASWYSIESLKKEGTWKRTKGVMANGQKFNDSGFTCAAWGYPFGTMLLVTNIQTLKSIRVRVTDRISERFAKTRIDLSRLAFSQLAELERGVISVKVEKIK